MQPVAKHLVTQALLEAQNALLDYIDRLEKQGCTLAYGRSVLKRVELALVIMDKQKDTAQ